jgi:1,2-phenylacetyl-CoA epoxidase catalytic subunit
MEITKDQYLNLKDMLASSDEETREVAYSILREKSFEENKTVFLMLAKTAKQQLYITWKKELADKQVEFLKVLRDNPSVSYQVIFNYLTKTKSDVEQIQFLLDQFTNDLKDQLDAMGYSFVKDLELTIYTDDKQPRELSKSI